MDVGGEAAAQTATRDAPAAPAQPAPSEAAPQTAPSAAPAPTLTSAAVAEPVASAPAAIEWSEPPPPRPDGWRYEIDPFAWLPVNVSGDVTVGKRTVAIDANLSDLTQNLELAAAASFEAWNGRFGLIASGVFLKLGQSGQLPGPLGASFDATSRLFAGNLLAGWRPVVAELGGGARLSLEIDAGARLAWLDSDLQIGSESFGGSSAVGRGLVGGRIPLRVSRGFGLGVRGGVYFPGVGWSSLGWVEVDPLKWLGVTVAYRAERLELTSDRASLSATAHGPASPWDSASGAAGPSTNSQCLQGCDAPTAFSRDSL